MLKKIKSPPWTDKEDDALRSLVHIASDGQNERKLTWWEIAFHMQAKASQTKLSDIYREYTEFAVQHRWRHLQKEAKEAERGSVTAA
jgi:hypothetical protein